LPFTLQRTFLGRFGGTPKKFFFTLQQASSAGNLVFKERVSQLCGVVKTAGKKQLLRNHFIPAVVKSALFKTQGFYAEAKKES
jgi:hypothetical protein